MVVLSSGQVISPTIDTEKTVISKEPPAAIPLPLANLPPAEMGRLLQGQRLGHYELQEFVGGGGMGAVFRALDTMLNRPVAVKILSKVQSGDEENLRRFKNEAQSAARLDHENIGRVHYVGEDRGWHYIVFEFIEGENLRDVVIRKGPLPLTEALSYTLQVADALAHASRRDVVHRDIKPSNVLITPEGRAKLVDMGLARLHQVQHPDNDLTASGVTLGTFDYISPEQARDPRNADVRSDLYSLGCTLYYLLTGRPPFPEGTVLQKLLQHQSEEAPDPRVLRPDVPEDLSRVVRKLLVKNPQQRYQQPDDLAADLLMLAAKHGLQLPTPTAAQWASRRDQAPSFLVRHLPWIGPIAALGLVALALAIWGNGPSDNVHPAPIQHVAGVGTTPTDVNPGSGDHGASGGTANKSANDQTSAPTTTGPVPATGGLEIVARPSTGAPIVTTAQIADTLADLRSQVKTLVARVEEMADKSLEPRPHVDSGAAVAGPRSHHLPDTAGPAETASNDSPSTTAAGNPAADRKGLLIVSRPRSGHGAPGEYASLAEACRAAHSGDVVELRYNGRLDEQPLSLSGVRLTIRAGEGFAPIVGFEPKQGDPWDQNHTMLALPGSQLTLLNLRLELDVPRDVAAESWTLAEVRPGEAIRLEGCTVTVRNPPDPTASGLRPDVTVFDVRSVPGMGVMPGPDSSGTGRPPASLQLKNCVVRGEALLVRSEQAQPLQLTWDNGLLVTSERLLWAAGGPSDPKPQGQMQLELRHVTAVARSGLCRLMETQDAPLQLPLEISASDCIFMCDSTAALIEQSGVDDPEDFRRRVVWNGDRNFYENFSTFWRIDGAGEEVAAQMTLHDWQSFWGSREIQPALGQVVWQALPSDTRPVSAQLPADYALRAANNPAHNAASDGHDAGCQLDLLPNFSAAAAPSASAP